MYRVPSGVTVTFVIVHAFGDSFASSSSRKSARELVARTRATVKDPPGRSRSDEVRRGASAAAPNLKDGIPRRFESDENWGELHRMTWGFDSSSLTPAGLRFCGIPGGPGAAGHSFLPSYIIVRGIW